MMRDVNELARRFAPMLCRRGAPYDTCTSGRDEPPQMILTGEGLPPVSIVQQRRLCDGQSAFYFTIVLYAGGPWPCPGPIRYPVVLGNTLGKIAKDVAFYAKIWRATMRGEELPQTQQEVIRIRPPEGSMGREPPPLDKWGRAGFGLVRYVNPLGAELWDKAEYDWAWDRRPHPSFD